MKLTRRGFVLVEVLVSAAVLLWALEGIVFGMSAAGAQLGLSLKEQQCNALAQERVEQLSQTSTAGWGTLVTTSPVSEPSVDGYAGWTRTTTYTLGSDSILSPAVPPTPVFRAVITVTSPGGTNATRVVQKWPAY